MQRRALCGSRRELSHEYVLAQFGFDTAENDPGKVCPLSAYRSPRLIGTTAGPNIGKDRAPLKNSLAIFFEHTVSLPPKTAGSAALIAWEKRIMKVTSHVNEADTDAWFHFMASERVRRMQYGMAEEEVGIDTKKISIPPATFLPSPSTLKICVKS